MRLFLSPLWIVPLLLPMGPCLRADVSLPALFGNGLVLQRDRPVALWGRADPGEKVAVSYEGQEVITTAPADGRWIVYLGPLAARNTGADLVVAGKNRITLSDVVAGEVWLCAGQSNMEFTVDRADRAAAEIAGAAFPLIRQFKVARAAVAAPTDAIAGEWKTATRENVGAFTAVGYFFARDLHRKLGIPIGIINSSWGGSPIEAWLSPAALASDPAFAVIATREHAISPCTLFNGMINPVLPFGLRGALWYQGEANASRANEYPALFTAMITYWRSHFGQGDFPFYWVQLANFKTDNPASGHWPSLREAQSRALSLPDTGQAVTIDIGNPDDIHPRNKQEVGRRLALMAKAQVYGIAGDYSGPVFAGAERERNGMRIKFRHAGTGLTARDKPVQSIEVAGPDKVFYPAKAVILGDSLFVSAPEVRAPVAVRYAWRNAPEANLYNGAGLPAAPFRSDDWK